MLQNLFKSSDAIVQQIHDEIDQAQDSLLEQARKIISDNAVGLSGKGLRLEALGFVNSEVAVKAKKQRGALVDGMNQSELIEYYKQEYPFQKFITESEMDRICTKYGLVYAPVSRYLKDVPEKNLKEIEDAKKIADKDRVPNFSKCRIKLQDQGYKNDSFLYRSHPLYKKLPTILDGHYSSQFDVDRYYQSKFDCDGLKYLCSSTENIIIDRQGLFIAAPKSHFDLEGTQKEGKFGFLNFEIVPVKDPIVFRYCRGGIQIISKWGLEAQDEIVTNPIEN